MALLKNIEEYLASANSNLPEKDVTLDINYIRKSCALVTEALQKGCDVMQMPNGDIIITEVKTLTFQYSWDEKKGRMVRVQSGGRLKKVKSYMDRADELESSSFSEEESSLDAHELEDEHVA